MTIRLLSGDARDVLPTLPAESVQCVVCSPIMRECEVVTLYDAGMTDIPIEVLAYCAGVIDSDGTIGIRRSTYGMRVLKNRLTVGYWARIGVKQVEPDAVVLLKEAFGGAGTTALVADRLQRDCIGIDLNTQYTAMAMERCRADAPLLADLGPMPEHPEESAMADLFTDMAAD